MSFDHQTLSAVWGRGKTVGTNDPSVWRQDSQGAWIAWKEYGNRNSQYGWEVDHINPNGGDILSNLQPLQWENNVAKSNGRPVKAVTAQGQNNVKVS